MSECYIVDGPCCTEGGFNFQQFFFAAGPFSTTSLTYVQAASFSTSSDLLAGTYIIQWNATYTNTANNSNVSIRVQVDNTTTINDQLYGVRAAPRTFVASGRRTVSLTDGTHTIDVDFSAGSATATISQIEIFIYRIS